MMIETEHTPNPDTLKFLPGKKVSEVGPIEFLKKDKSIKIPLANKILSLEGTVMVFFGEDFITVKKEKNLNWKDMKHGIISEINDYYSKGNEVVVSKDSKLAKILSESASDSKPVQSNEIINKINEVLDSKIRPAVARDGGDITFKSCSFFTVIKFSPKNTITIPSKDNILLANDTLIFLSFFKNSIGPTSETFFPGKNFNVSGFGVCSISTIIITT